MNECPKTENFSFPQEFPWTQGKDINAESHTILPLAQVSGFQLNAEDFT